MFTVNQQDDDTPPALVTTFKNKFIVFLLYVSITIYPPDTLIHLHPLSSNSCVSILTTSTLLTRAHLSLAPLKASFLEKSLYILI